LSVGVALIWDHRPKDKNGKGLGMLAVAKAMWGQAIYEDGDRQLLIEILHGRRHVAG